MISLGKNGKKLNTLFVLIMIMVISAFTTTTPAILGQEGTDDDEGRLAAPASTVEYVDLNNWVWVGPGDANWVVEPGGRTVYQTVNSQSPCLYQSDVDIFNKVVICEFEVKDTSDNDNVGFVFGMQSPNDRVSDNYEFILFDWKKEDQGTAKEGFALTRVNGSFPSAGYNDNYFWGHTDTGPGATPEFDVLATDWTTTNGWVPNQRYEVRILYTANRFKVTIDGNTIFDYSGSFQNGKMGFYCVSQEQVYFRAVKHAPGSDVEQPPVATNDSYFAQQGTPMSKDRFDGVLANDFDYNLDTYTLHLDSNVSNGSLTLNADGSFSYTPNGGFVGTDSFTYHVTDNDGNSNTATASIVVMTTNEAPTDIQISNQKVPESPTNGQQIATFTTTDPNVGDIHDYMLINNGGGRFGVSGDKLVVANASAISPTGQYSITVRTTDVGGLYYDETFTIYGGDTATLTITTTPSSGKWRPVGTTTWLNSGDSTTIAAATDVAVEFSDITGYDTPSNRTYNIPADGSDSDSVVYVQQLGNLTATTNPGSGQWRIVGSGSWSNSGDTLTGIPVGNYVVEFNSLTNYDKPANQNVTITKNNTTSITGNYVEHLGSIRVTTDPTSGQWRIVGSGSWNASGATVSNLSVGNYEIEFSAIADYDSPANKTLAVTKDNTTTYTGTYVQHKGSVKVNIDDPTNGKWRFTGESSWRDAGSTASDLVVGNYTIEFLEVDGYFTPDNVNVTVTKDTLHTEDITYVKKTGSLKITTLPEDGKWRIVGETEWRNSGDKVDDIPIGNVEVEFQGTFSHNPPANKTYVIESNKTTRDTVEYEIKIVRVKVNRVEMGHTTHDGKTDMEYGSSITIVAMPDENCKFVRWTGDLPAGVDATNSTLYLDHVYENLTFTPVFAKNLSSITVNIDGPPAAAWRIVGQTDWMKGGVTVADLLPGTYTIEYQWVQGWVEPATFNITVGNGDNVTREGIYENIQEEYPPRIHYFTSNVEYISEGSEVRLEWYIKGGEAKSITRIGEVNGNVNYIDVRVNETTQFELTASNENGTTKARTTVVVIQKPEIMYFISSNNEDNPVFAGNEAELSWFVKGAETVEIEGVDDEISADKVETGSCMVTPAKTKTYRLVATNAVASSTAEVTVPVTKLPEIKSFTSSHSTLPAGAKAELQWQVEGADTTVITPDPGTVDVEGSAKVSPKEDTVFTLEAENKAGKVSSELEIKVIENNFDLTTEILEVKEPVVVGKTCRVTLKVTNHGNTAANNVVVRLSDGKKHLAYYTVNRLRGGASKVFTMKVVPLNSPKLTFNAMVDPDDKIREKKERNNKDSMKVVSQEVKGIDLLPRNITIEAVEGKPEGTFVISYIVSNVGRELSEGFQCDVYVNTGPKGKYEFLFADEADELKSGKDIKFQRTVFMEEVPAKMKVKVEVDSLKANFETNEDNNDLTQKK